MRKKFFLLILLIELGLTTENIAFAAITKNRDIQNLVDFLTSTAMLVTSKSGVFIPLSFYVGTPQDVAQYFGNFICIPDLTCSVVDTLYVNPFVFLKNPLAIFGRGLPPQQGSVQTWFQAQAQIERQNANYGTDIYHAALWQVALALAAANGYLDSLQARSLIDNELASISNPANRATGIVFLYGYQLLIFNPLQAFSFRLIATNFFNKDPFFGGPLQQVVTWDFNLFEIANSDPEGHSPNFFQYAVSWFDWKPLTAENAWAQLIGPLQAEFILTGGNISANSKALVNAVNTLFAFSAMQTGLGAFYSAPGGTLGGQGELPVGEVSIAANFAVLAGLQILNNTLQTMEQTEKILQAQAMINVMLFGGTTVNGFPTQGLLSFLFNGAFDTQSGVFFTQGFIDTKASLWQPNTSGELSLMAVDVNLWGLSALGVETVDTWFGEGTALGIWRTVRKQGGYFQNNQLWGLGFSLNNNAMSESEAIMSGNNSAAGINTVISLINHYSQLGVDVSDLQEDLANLTLNINNLRNDNYLLANFVGATPRDSYINLPPEFGRAFLYASRHFPLPFLWNAETLASTSATSWVLVNRFNFNPFQYAGRFVGENYPIPPKVTISEENLGLVGRDSLPKTLSVRFTSGNLGQVTKLILSFNLDGSQSNWIVAGSTLQSQGVASIPLGATGIMISFFNVDWANACQVIPATKICKDPSCMGVFSIAARWSADGQGSCELID